MYVIDKILTSGIIDAYWIIIISYMGFEGTGNEGDAVVRKAVERLILSQDFKAEVDQYLREHIDEIVLQATSYARENNLDLDDEVGMEKLLDRIVEMLKAKEGAYVGDLSSKLKVDNEGWVSRKKEKKEDE